MNLKMVSIIVVLVTGLTWGLGSTPVVQSATLTVTTTADTNDGTCDTDCSLREAIIVANATDGVDTIILPAGVYALSIDGNSDNLAVSGDLDITGNLVIVGAGAASTIVDGGGLDRVLDINPAGIPGINVEISGMTILGGEAPLGPGGDFRFEAGGVYNRAMLTLANSVVRANIGGIGGGIFNSGSLTLTNTVVGDNTADIGASGGGIYNHGILTLINSTISKNFAYAGGGISNDGTMTLTNSTISGNNSGGISNSGPATLVDSTISGNTGDGGILHFSYLDTDAIVIISSTISGNSGKTFGTLPNRGGGITHRRGTMTIADSTVSGNSADAFGGGISVQVGTLNLNNVTITNNAADSDVDGTGDGGGLFNDSGIVKLGNTIIAGNFSGNVYPDCMGTMISRGYNLIGNAAGCNFGIDPTTKTGVNPSWGSLQNNGGSTLTHALLAGSLAIDAGNPATPGIGENACEATDQRGITRPKGAACDIGAYEFEFSGTFLPLILKSS